MDEHVIYLCIGKPKEYGRQKTVRKLASTREIAVKPRVTVTMLHVKALRSSLCQAVGAELILSQRAIEL
jgi:hypothetical protein